MTKTKAIKKDKDVLSNHIKTIKNLIGVEKFADDLIEFLDTYSTGNHTLLNEAVFDIAGKHDIIFDDDGNLDEEYADSYHASTKKSKIDKTGTIVDVRPEDLTVAVGFWSAGLQSIDSDERLDVHVSLDIGDEWGAPPLEASWETRIPISELISPELVQEFKQKGADIITKQVIQYNSRFRREYGGSDDMYTLYYASTKKSMDKSKYSDIRKRLNKIGGFTKDEKEIEIDDDDVVEIEDEGGEKKVEIESKEDHAEEVADGEESEDDNLNECNRNVKSKKTVKGMRASKKRMKMRKDDDDYIGDEDDDDEDDSARATGKPAPWELEDEEEEEANKRRKSVKRVKMRKAEDMPEDADEQQNINEKGSGSAGSDMPEDADDNQDENDAGTGNAGSELPEDADEQQNIKESARKARLARMRRSAKKSVNRPPVKKFSVTNGGQPNQESFNGRYQQSPMVRDAIDGHFGSKTEKFNEVDMMNERINDLMKSRRNPVSNNGVPKRIH